MADQQLKVIGPQTLNEPGSPVRHKTKRRRIKTVMQEIMGKAARMISHAGQMVVGLGCNDETFAVLRMSRKDQRCNRVVILSRPTG